MPAPENLSFRLLPCLTMAALLLAGCGAPDHSSAPADVMVTVDGQHRICMASLPAEPQGSSVPCQEVAAFVRDELRLARGSKYALRTGSAADAQLLARVRADLEGAGYVALDPGAR